MYFTLCHTPGKACACSAKLWMSHHISIWFRRDTIFFLQSTALLWRGSGGGWWAAVGKICPKTLQNILKHHPRSFGKCSPLIQRVETCLIKRLFLPPPDFLTRQSQDGEIRPALCGAVRRPHTRLPQPQIGVDVGDKCERSVLHAPHVHRRRSCY